jgi:hypothetical protein
MAFPTKGPLGLNAAGRNFTVDYQSVLALEAEGDAHAKLVIGRLGGPKLLQHQGSIAML